MRGVKRALTLGLALIVAGCGGGGGGGEATTDAAPPTAAPVTVTTTPDTAQAAATPTGNPTFDVELSGASPTAQAGRPWRYTVRATNKRGGGPAMGTAKMRVFLDGELVDTLGFFVLRNGTLSRTHKWPTVLKGKSGVVLQAEVEGAGGTQRVNYPVTVS